MRDLCPRSFDSVGRAELAGFRVAAGGVGLEVAQCAENGIPGVVYDCSLLLAAHLAAHPELVRSRRVVELGCGTGVVSLCAAQLGGKVLALDRSAPALELVRRSAEQQGLDVEVQQYSFGDAPAWAGDLLLGADVCYEAASMPKLATTLREAIAPGGAALLVVKLRSPEVRACAQALVQQANLLGLRVRRVALDGCVELATLCGAPLDPPGRAGVDALWVEQQASI